MTNEDIQSATETSIKIFYTEAFEKQQRNITL